MKLMADPSIQRSNGLTADHETKKWSKNHEIKTVAENTNKFEIFKTHFTASHDKEPLRLPTPLFPKYSQNSMGKKN